MMLDFHVVDIRHNDFELYELHLDGEKIGKFVLDERETHNSMLTLKKDLDLTALLLSEIGSEVYYEFGNIHFVMGYDV